MDAQPRRATAIQKCSLLPTIRHQSEVLITLLVPLNDGIVTLCFTDHLERASQEMDGVSAARRLGAP